MPTDPWGRQIIITILKTELQTGKSGAFGGNNAEIQ